MQVYSSRNLFPCKNVFPPSGKRVLFPRYFLAGSIVFFAPIPQKICCNFSLFHKTHPKNIAVHRFGRKGSSQRDTCYPTRMRNFKQTNEGKLKMTVKELLDLHSKVWTDGRVICKSWNLVKYSDGNEYHKIPCSSRKCKAKSSYHVNYR